MIDDLLGGWRLESAVEVFDDGERRDEFGPNPEGYLCYHPAGIVSATLGDSARPPIPADDPQSGTGDDYEQMARHYSWRPAMTETTTTPDRTVLTGKILSQAAFTATIDAPTGRIDIAGWLRTLPDREYQRCAPPDHKAAGYTTTDDGRPMSINVEMIGTGLVVQHYAYQTAGERPLLDGVDLRRAHAHRVDHRPGHLGPQGRTDR